MTTNASAGLITALKNSLADVDAGWVVTNVVESSGTRISSISTSSDSFSVPGGGAASAITAVGANSATTVITQVDLAADPLRVAIGSASPMALRYLSVWVSGSFSAGHIIADGAQLATSDAPLDTTIRALAAAFNTARDTSLKDALNDGPVAAGDDPLLIPEDLLTALKATLADDTWEARSRSEYVQGSGSSLVSKIVVSLSAPMTRTDGVLDPYVRLLPDSRAPGQIGYEATVDSQGELIEAVVRLNSAMWRTGLDDELHTAIMAMADDFTESQAVNVTAAFEAGPL